MSCKDILISWLNKIQDEGRNEVANFMMSEVVEYGFRKYGISHQMSTYEREFRRLKEKYGFRFYKKRTDKNGVVIWGIREKG